MIFVKLGILNSPKIKTGRLCRWRLQQIQVNGWREVGSKKNFNKKHNEKKGSFTVVVCFLDGSLHLLIGRLQGWGLGLGVELQASRSFNLMRA